MKFENSFHCQWNEKSARDSSLDGAKILEQPLKEILGSDDYRQNDHPFQVNVLSGLKYGTKLKVTIKIEEIEE